MKRKSKGYTLMELLISLGIMCFIISLIMTFFLTSLNNYEVISTYSNLQFQAQYIMNFIANKVMESNKVVVIKIDGSTSVINSTREFGIAKISLSYNKQSKKCYNFDVRNNKIYYGNDFSDVLATSELGTFISELKVAPHPDGKTFADANALKITIYLVKDNQSYNVSQIVRMRNYY